MSEYSDALPFPHAVLDDWLTPDEAAAIEAEFPDEDDPRWHRYDNVRERKLEGRSEMWGPRTIELAERLASPEHVTFVGDLTGISGLEAAFLGGGYHQIARGGLLDMHVDFNRLGALYRRVNFLVYLTPGWRDEWEGHLVLWKPDRSETKRIAPIAGRAAVFSTGEQNFHGHPIPLATPPGVYRRSFACYYYSPMPAPDSADEHSTVFL